jgi:heat shock protein HtpX
MLRAYGLQTHIQANRMRSALLLAGFVGLLCMLTYSFALLYETRRGGTVGWMMARAWRDMSWMLPWAAAATLAWFAVAWAFHQRMVAFATGAVDLPAQEAPDLHHLVETMCISRGLPTPRLMVIETDALNAYASGLDEGDATITVTRGLMETLTPQEMEAVLAHELTHLRNKDTQLLVVAVIFTGIFSFIGDLVFRNLDFPLGRLPRSSGKSSGDNKGAVFIVVLIALALIALSWGLAMLTRLALSRSREFMADAGAVELTKNPDALISALRKIEKRATIPDMSSRMSAFFIESPLVRQSNDWFATHPSMDARVAALVAYAGGRTELVDDEAEAEALADKLEAQAPEAPPATVEAPAEARPKPRLSGALDIPPAGASPWR